MITSPPRTGAFLDTQIGEPPLDFRGDDRFATGHNISGAVSSGVPDGRPPDLPMRGVVVSTSVVANALLSHQKIVPEATMNTSRTVTTHAPRRERGRPSSRRGEFLVEILHVVTAAPAIERTPSG